MKVKVSASSVLAVAKKYLGVKESPPNSNKVIFNTAYYGTEVCGASYPWCLVFQWYVFREAGASALFYDGKKCAYTPTMANWFKAKKRFYSTPKVGDLVFYQFPGSNRINHVGIVSEILGPNKIKAIEGNTSIGNDSNGGKVIERTRATTYVKGYGRPEYDTEVVDPSSVKYTKENFIKDVQKALNVPVTGKADDVTFNATITVSKSNNNKHAVVVPLEKYMKALGYYKGNIDGFFWNEMDKAIKNYQKTFTKYPDGIIDKKETTWKKLLGM